MAKRASPIAAAKFDDPRSKSERSRSAPPLAPLGSDMRMTFWRGFLRRALLMGLILLAALPAGRASAAEKGELPIPAATLALMAAHDTTPAAPILMRAYKKESEIEIWKKNSAGRFVFLKSFPICRWSGTLGPKTTQGDRQTPEGFYAVGATQMNPNSHYYLSFDTGYPNAFDRAHGGSGSAVMVHGTCSSAGCFAMTDKGVGEIFALAREALRGGQSAFQFQSYPFRMSAQNMARYRADPNIAFWRQLKEGSDRFEATGEELAVSVADRPLRLRALGRSGARRRRRRRATRRSRPASPPSSPRAAPPCARPIRTAARTPISPRC